MLAVLPKVSIFLSGIGLVGGTQLFSPTTEPISREELIAGTKGNCSVVDNLEKVIKALELKGPYIAVTCKTEGESDFGILGDTWTGLFPSIFLKRDKWGFGGGRGLNIMTKTDYAEEVKGVGMFNTVFSSKQFVNPKIVGNWDYGEIKYDDKSVDVVTPIRPQAKEKIYFVHVD